MTENKNNDNNSNSLKTKWGNRFIIAAIIQGGIITGMALGTVAFQLLTTDVDIIQFLSLSFEGPAKWFFIGIILYLILIVAIATTAVFYNHLEINLKRKFSKVSNILAWIHLFGMNIGGAGYYLTYDICRPSWFWSPLTFCRRKTRESRCSNIDFLYTFYSNFYCYVKYRCNMWRYCLYNGL